MAVPKQSTIRRIQQQRDFFKNKEEKEEEKITDEEHAERLKKLKELGLIK